MIKNTNSFVLNWLHLIWTTPNLEPLLKEDRQEDIFTLISLDCQDKGIDLEEINGEVDHVHVLIRLRRTQTIAGVVNHMKGCSSRWMEEEWPEESPFGWKKRYAGVSVGLDRVEEVRQFIRNQKIIHQKITLQQELEVIAGSHIPPENLVKVLIPKDKRK
ncbi:MAG: IS200/IS605 family transposase [Bacteroidia bacterium]|nr:IS200/IS605 family transposase [Bacteroidia bacterium]